MFLFSPKFDWSFHHLSRFMWGCWTLPKCSYFTQLFLILPKTLFKFFIWRNFDERCWNHQIIPVHSRAVFILPSGAKKNDKIVSEYFAVLDIILPLMWLLFWPSLENRHYLITYECSCTLCPNNGQYFSPGDATASPASTCRTLMALTVINPKKHQRLADLLLQSSVVTRNNRVSCVINSTVLGKVSLFGKIVSI